MSGYQPTTEQQAILGHDPCRHARVLAGPGTGKSATLIAMINKLVNRDPAPRLKLLTFTRAATAELAHKVTTQTTGELDRPSTIHSFAISVLLGNPGAGGFPEPLRIADRWEDRHIVEPTLRRHVNAPLRNIRRLIAEMAANWESLHPERDPEVDQQTRARFLDAWRRHRAIFGYTLLAEIPYRLREALEHHPDLRHLAYDVLMVDEYQDLNACDLEVLSRLAQRGCVVVATGDDDQSIYSFRKAAPEGIRRFPSDYPDAADYPLTVTQRCGRKIVEWANHVIQGDSDRPEDKPCLVCAPGAPEGEVGLYAFRSDKAEAKGVASLAERLINDRDVDPSDVLILLRSDHNAMFSRPIKQELDQRGIPYSDPDYVERLLTEDDNRRLMVLLHLMVDSVDSLAWASLMKLTHGVGDSFVDQIYQSALSENSRFGERLIAEYEQGFEGYTSRSARQATQAIQEALRLTDGAPLPEVPANGWGHWIIDVVDAGSLPGPTDEFRALLLKLDDAADQEHGLGRFLGQVSPLGKDLATSTSSGIRIMSMASSKGLTVRATIIAGMEDQIIPQDNVADQSEERRLLYVAMTRSREFLYGTWARTRRGPTARAGRASVGRFRQLSTFLQGGPVSSEEAS